MKDTLRLQFDRLGMRLQELDARLADPASTHDMNKFRELSREQAEASEIVELYRRFTQREADRATAQDMLAAGDDDADMVAMAREELAACDADLESLDAALQATLLPRDPDDARPAFVEIRAGSGGEESALFAADLLRMYLRYAERQGWRSEIMSESQSDLGGFKEVVVRLENPSGARGLAAATEGVYGQLRFESGGHRVQRVPATETQGRVHSSACTVAVLAEPDAAAEVTLNPSELRIDTYRASGAGGQPHQQDRQRGAHHARAHRHRRRVPGRPLAAPQQGQGDERAARAPARARARGTRRARCRRTQEPDRLRRQLRPHPHLQLPAGPAHRPPHQPDALQAGRGDGRRSGRGGGRAARGARAGATGGAGIGRMSGHFPNVGDALQAARDCGVDRLDAQLLLGNVMGQSRTWLLTHAEASMSDAQDSAFQELVARRAAGEPFAYLVGEREFHGLTLAVNAAVLVPRPDTETLVDWALALLEGELSAAPAPALLDLGTGSGAIALALKNACAWARVWAGERSADALAVARANAARLQLDVRFAQGDWWAALKDAADVPEFDLVVSNPPYIVENDPHLADLKHEPLQALVSDGHGLGDIARIATGARGRLRVGGWLLFEHGWEQAGSVRQILERARFGDIETRPDIEGRPRCTGGRLLA